MKKVLSHRAIMLLPIVVGLAILLLNAAFA